MPKGVVWRQEDVFFALGGGYDAYTNEPVPHDRFLAERAAAGEGIQLRSLTLAPLMHGAGQWGSLRFFFEGNTAVFQERFDAREAWELIERERLTNIMMTGDAMGRPLIEALREHRHRARHRPRLAVRHRVVGGRLLAVGEERVPRPPARTC